MVGIARGRGCGTCKKRKIACGLEKPSCAQCIKSKRACTGYRKYPIFIAHQPPKQENQGTESGVSTPDKVLVKSRTCQQRRSTEDADGRHSDTAGLRLIGSAGVLGMHVNSNPALRQQLLGAYLDVHLSKCVLGPLQQRIWLLRVPTLPYLTTALDVSMMALSLAKLGELQGDPELKLESLKLYHRGLHQLQKALWDDDLMYHDQTLAACVALSMYEMSQCPDGSKNAYITHTLGCEKLIQLRGPEAHVDGLGHSVFVHYRVQGILYALDTRQHTFLSDPVWQEVPWRHRPKTVYDQIYDFLTRAPELLLQGEMLAHMNPPSQMRLASEMISKCWKMDAELLSLYDQLEDVQEGPLYWPELARDDDSDDDSEDGKVFPVAFHFPNLAIANTVLVAWAVQVMLWQGMSDLYGLMDQLRAVSTPEVDQLDAFAASDCSSTSDTVGVDLAGGFPQLPPLEHRADFATPALNIFQSVEYCLQEEMADSGPKCVAFPLRVVMETMRHYPQYARELKWAEEAMARVQRRSLRLLMYYTPTER